MSQQRILVVGAGLMGAGIAQVAALSGHPVFLFDQRAGAAKEGHARIAAAVERLSDKGKLTRSDASAALERIHPIEQLRDGHQASVAIEAVVEDLEVKRGLMRELEELLDSGAVLATNTSSFNITAIAAGLKFPERVVGMHFFNPVPLMALVEVVSGLRTSPKVVEAIETLAREWGKVAVRAQSSPGFIVNRIARPYYAEALMLLQEKALRPEVVDALLRAAGFRMGPCELMDLIGHDTNFAVTRSVFESNFYDRRYTPSLVQKELVEGGLFGRKSGRGFYEYPAGAPEVVVSRHPQPEIGSRVVVHGSGLIAEQLHCAMAAVLTSQGCLRAPESDWTGVEIDGRQLRLTDGRTAGQVAREEGLADLALFDEPPEQGGHLAFAVIGGLEWRAQAPAWLQALGWKPVEMADSPGLVVARTLAMLVNEAADAVQQGVCTAQGADAAMRLGVNYPAGPFQWLERLGVDRVVRIIESLDRCYRGERYRVSSWLQRRPSGLAGEKGSGSGADAA